MVRMDTLLSTRMHAQRGSPIRELLQLTERPGMLSMAGGLPAGEALPVQLLTDAFERALRHTGVTGPTALQYGPTPGLARLREQIADDHGVHVDNVVVTTGAQQSLDLLARALCDPGDVIVADDPTYVGALQAFRFAGARVVGPHGDEPDDPATPGFDTIALDAQLRAGLRPKAVYVVSNFHNPTGHTLTSAQRSHLLVLAQRHGFLIIDDDPYGALRFRGDAPEAMGGHDRPVVTLGTASKILAPGLRVGWMSGPPVIAEAVGRIKQFADLHTSSLNQLMVAEARDDKAAFEAHLRRSRRLYESRADALRIALATHLGDRVSFAHPEGGFFLWLTLHDSAPAETVLRAAVDEGVAFVPGTAFSADGTSFTDRARLSYATLDAAGLDEACRRLARALDRTSRPVAAS
jgi:2-aminoadipate transaminase